MAAVRYDLVSKEVCSLAVSIYKRNCSLNEKEIRYDKVEILKTLDVMDLLDIIKSKIDKLFTFKEHMQIAEGAGLSKKIQEYQTLIHKLENDLRLKARNEQQLTIDLEEAKTKIERLQQKKAEVVDSSKNLMSEIRNDNQSLIDLLKFKELHIDDLKSQLDSHKQLIKTFEAKVARLPGLENEIKDWERKYKSEMHKLTVKHKAELGSNTKELAQHRRVLASHSKYEEKNKKLSLEIESYKRQSRKQEDFEKRINFLKEKVEGRDKEINQLEMERNRLKARIEMDAQEIKKLNAILDGKERKLKDAINQKPDPEQLQHLYDANIVMVEHYKQKCEKKDKEINHLKYRLRKMYQSERSGKLKEVGFDSERKMYLDKIGSLYKSNSEMEQVLSNKLQKGEIPFSSDTKLAIKEHLSKANYDNMMELAKTASSAMVESNKQLRKIHNEERLVSARPPKAAVSSPQFSARPQTASTRVSTRPTSNTSSRATFRPFSRSNY